MLTLDQAALLWRQVGAVYEQLSKAEHALGAYMKAIELQPNAAQSLCGFSRVAKGLSAELTGTAASLLDVYVITLLGDYQAAVSLLEAEVAEAGQGDALAGKDAAHSEEQMTAAGAAVGTTVAVGVAEAVSMGLGGTQ